MGQNTSFGGSTGEPTRLSFGKGPGHPTKKKLHNFANLGLSRRQNQPLASKFKKQTCPEKWCTCQKMTPLPFSLTKEFRTTDYALPRLRLSRLKIQEHLSPKINNVRFSPNKQRECERKKAVSLIAESMCSSMVRSRKVIPESIPKGTCP